MIPSLLATASLGLACAVLSVFVVLRRWAFIGEGIAHAGFGGAGTAWMLALLFPSVALFSTTAGVYAVAVAFSLAVALAIGWVTRRDQVNTDTAIGIFLVASLAWGFVGLSLFRQEMQREPTEWTTFLWGHLALLGPGHTLSAVLICAAVLLVVAALGKEILFYCFDPAQAEVSGVRVGFIHYLLIFLVAATIVLGMPMMGSVLVTALLVLPGAAALQLSRKLNTVFAVSIAVGLTGALAGPLIAAYWPFVPAGPAIVLVLVAEFLAIFIARQAVARR